MENPFKTLATSNPIEIDLFRVKPGVAVILRAFNRVAQTLGLNLAKLQGILKNASEDELNEKMGDFKIKIASAYGLLETEEQEMTKNKDQKMEYPEHYAYSLISQAMKNATGVLSTLISLYDLDEEPNFGGVMKELEIPDPNIIRALRRLLKRPTPDYPTGVDIKHQFLTKTWLVLFDIAMRGLVLATEEKWHDILSKLTTKINQMFSCPFGRTTIFNFELDFDPETNSASFQGTETTNQNNQETINFPITLKPYQGFWIDIEISQKSSPSRIIKTLAEALKQPDRPFIPYVSDDPERQSIEIQDRIRLRIIVPDDLRKEDIESIHKEISQIIKPIYTQRKPPQNDPGSKPTFFDRYIFYLENNLPIEIMYTTVSGYFNDRYDIGKRRIIEVVTVNGTKHKIKIYDGSAHEIYELRRAIPLLFLFFPYEIFRRKKEDGTWESEEEYYSFLVEKIEQAFENKAEQLRNQTKKFLSHKLPNDQQAQMARFQPGFLGF